MKKQFAFMLLACIALVAFGTKAINPEKPPGVEKVVIDQFETGSTVEAVVILTVQYDVVSEESVSFVEVHPVPILADLSSVVSSEDLNIYPVPIHYSISESCPVAKSYTPGAYRKARDGIRPILV